MSLLLEINQRLEEKLNIDLSVLHNSPDFKGLSKYHPAIARAIELQWGYPEFYVYIKKILDGMKLGGEDFQHLDKLSKEAIGSLTSLHNKAFPAGKTELKKIIRPDIWGPEYERGFMRDLTEAEVAEMKEFFLAD